MNMAINYNAVTRTLRLSSSSIDSGDGGEGRVGVVGVVDVLERPKRGIRKGSRVGGDFFSLTTGSWALVNELNFSKVPLETIVRDDPAPLTLLHGRNQQIKGQILILKSLILIDTFIVHRLWCDVLVRGADRFVFRGRFSTVPSTDPFADVRLLHLLLGATLLHLLPEAGDFTRHHFLGRRPLQRRSGRTAVIAGTAPRRHHRRIRADGCAAHRSSAQGWTAFAASGRRLRRYRRTCCVQPRIGWFLR